MSAEIQSKLTDTDFAKSKLNTNDSWNLPLVIFVDRPFDRMRWAQATAQRRC